MLPSRVQVFALLTIVLLVYSVSSTQKTSHTDFQDLRKRFTTSQTPDYWPTEEWQTTTPEEQGMNSTYLKDMIDYINRTELEVDSVVVIRNGYIVFEEYFNRLFGPNARHTVQSVTKSFTSTCVGIAIQRGYLSGVYERMVDIFSDYTIENLDDWKNNITLEHLLTMSTGLEWHEQDIPYWEPGNDLTDMYLSDDMYQYVLDTPTQYEPGTRWAYHSGCSELLGGVVEISSGIDFIDFIEDFLFDPLGIDNYHWWNPPDNPQYGVSGGLYLTPRDMAKLGYLFLNNGIWDEQEIVSREWVETATISHYALAGSGMGYGYQWWTLDNTGVYCAMGHRDQRIFVSPVNNLVVVFNSNIPDGERYPTPYLLTRYILRSIGDFSPTTTTNDSSHQNTLLIIVSGSFLAVVIIYTFRKNFETMKHVHN